MFHFFYFLIFYKNGHVIYILIKDINLYLKDHNLFLSLKWAAFDDKLKKGYQKSISSSKTSTYIYKNLSPFYYWNKQALMMNFDENFFHVLNFYHNGRQLNILIKDINSYLKEINIYLLLKLADFDDEKEYVFDEIFFHVLNFFINMDIGHTLYIIIKDFNLYLQELNLFQQN